MKSMTAYGRGESGDAQLLVLSEIRAYNSRYLDISLRISPVYASLEEMLKTIIKSRLSRGRIEVKIEVQDLEKESSAGYQVDIDNAKAYFTALMQLKTTLSLKENPSLGLIAGADDVVRKMESERDPQKAAPFLRDAIRIALEELEQMRIKEGQYIGEDILRRLDYIEEQVEVIDKGVNQLLPRYQKRLEKRIGELTRGLVEIDPARIAQEAAFLADRSDISEELVRARSHSSQFRSIVEGDVPAGRKLNFLLQEFSREFNTMGAKADNGAIAHVVVDVKTELEKIREQVQNSE